ncbi:hypothetical protein HG530_003153 [Fusarium avenaceum]|nr:hypothetical protein HG530_003153 [Fusarium avenaceum]
MYPRRIIFSTIVLVRIKADLEARRRILRHKDKIVALLDEVGQVRSLLEGVVNLLLKACRTVVDPGQSKLETVAAAAALKCQVGKIPEIIAFVGVEQVSGSGAVGLIEYAHVRAEEE